MSILNKLMDTMRLTENDDDYFDEEDYEEEKPVIKKSFEMKGILIGTIALIYFLTFLILRASTRLVNILGETGNNVMMRLMGLILMVIAVECFVSGMKPILVDIIKEGCLGMIK